MERELHRQLYRIVYHLARATRTKHVQFPDRVIVMTYFWAVVHDRPVAWACRHGNWPPQARATHLPSASTMSRRLRRPGVVRLIDRVERSFAARLPRSNLCFIDAKPLPVGNGSGDRDARFGYGGGRIAKGYKLHVILEEKGVVRERRVETMSPREQIVAPKLIGQLQGHGTLVGDNAYDVNKLYTLAGRRGWQLLAPRRRGTRISTHVPQSPWRLRAHRRIPRRQRQTLLRQRGAIERFFGRLGNQCGGLGPLPNHVRGLRRVRQWVQAKLILYHLRLLKTAP
jgi:hypothetical protein